MRTHSALGFDHVVGFLKPDDVATVIEQVRAIARAAPFRTPTMPNGAPLALKVTSAGACGWWADSRGYRYVDKHPTEGTPWPPIPTPLLSLFNRALVQVANAWFEPDTLLVNHYGEHGALGMHVDRTEDNDLPIVSMSIGADALFLIGDEQSKNIRGKIVLASGDLLVQHGRGRRAYHGIAKLLPTIASPLPGLQRLNLTFRRARL